MVNNSRVVLEDSKEYLVIDRIESDKNVYIYLSNREDNTDFCCRKEIEERW